MQSRQVFALFLFCLCFFAIAQAQPDYMFGREYIERVDALYCRPNGFSIDEKPLELQAKIIGYALSMELHHAAFDGANYEYLENMLRSCINSFRGERKTVEPFMKQAYYGMHDMEMETLTGVSAFDPSLILFAEEVRDEQ